MRKVRSLRGTAWCVTRGLTQHLGWILPLSVFATEK
jgi:hypothetical protein